ncbi:MAG: inositol monophosphatase [Chthonomonadales bacterium]|nr:inositol monophosphatase [Chthonomonadales bacterium]
MRVDIRPIRDLVIEAGTRALRQWGTVAAEAKSDRSLVTEVDRAIEAFLGEGIARLHPDAGFAGEEFGRRNGDRADTWVCDPIDGTTNYVRGLPHWCVSLGLVRNGVAEAGVIWAPVLNRLYWAVRGEGAYCNDVRLAAPDRDAIEYEDLLCISTNGLKTLPTSGVEARLRCLGSIALELCLVAEGRAVGAIGLHEGIMDMAAAMCICEEAGCGFAYLDGSALTAGDLLAEWRTSRHFVAAPSRLRALLCEALAPGARG